MPKISNPQNFKGQGLISKEDLGLKSDEVLIVSGKTVDNTVVAPQFLPEIQFNNKGTVETLSMLPTIKFIGNCNVKQDPDTGELTIRIGENLNSSTFNTTDGQTTGTAVQGTIATASYIVSGTTAAQTVWKKGNDTANTLTINIKDGSDTGTAADKIHFDNPSGTFDVKVTGVKAGVATSYTWTTPQINTSTTHSWTNLTNDASTALQSGAYAQLIVTNWSEEEKKAEGAEGYSANVQFKINYELFNFDDGKLSLEITPKTGQSGAKTYTLNNFAYLLNDTTTKPAAPTDVKAVLPSNYSKQTFAGITSLKSNTVNCSANYVNLNFPATSASTGSQIKFDSANKSILHKVGDASSTALSSTTTTTYTGTATATGVLISNSVSNPIFTCSVSNCNGTSTESGYLYQPDGTTRLTTFDYYNGVPHASILGTGNRVTLASTTQADKVAYTDTAAPGDTDLMVYHGELQYPQAFITNSYFENSAYVAPDTTGQKEALFWFGTGQTVNSMILTINGSNLKSGLVTFGNSVANLLPYTGYSDDGSDESNSKKLVYKVTFFANKPTPDTGLFVKVVLPNGSTAKITSIEANI